MHEENPLAPTERSLHHPDHEHRTAIGVVLGVEDQGLERRFRVAGRRRQTLDDGLEHLFDTVACLGRAQHCIIRIETEILLDLFLDPLHVSGREVDLVDHRHHLEVVLEGKVQIGDRLRLDSLRSIDQQQCPLTRHQRSPHLVREIDVAGRVDEVEPVGLAIPGGVAEGYGIRLDRDAALAFDVHGVEDLVPKLTIRYRATVLDQPVGKGRLAVIDMRDDAEAPYVVQQSSRGGEEHYPGKGSGNPARAGRY